MDVYANVPVPGGIPLGFQRREEEDGVDAPSPPASKLEEFFPGEDTEGEDVNLQWLSIFVEDCFSNTTTFSTTAANTITANSSASNPLIPQPATKTQLQGQSTNPHYIRPPPPSPKSSRTKRRRLATSIYEFLSMAPPPPDPPLLHQTQWLADSELIYPIHRPDDNPPPPPPPQQPDSHPPAQTEAKGVGGEEYENDEEEEEESVAGMQQPKRCAHCLSQRTPQWRAGPQGPKTLCNACGVRFKSGRLLPEYRPAKSPTFVSYKHSNSHKKVLEMRMAVPSRHIPRPN